MPSFLRKNEKQLSTEEANKSRLVTKVRYVIEKVNGILKSRFRYFDNVWSNKSITHLMDDFKIACALHNAFFLRMESDIEDCDLIAETMLNNHDKPNLLLQLVNANNLIRKRKLFIKMNAYTLPDFPRLSERNLYHVALGRYQIRQAASYYSEHVKDNGKYEIQVHSENEDLYFSQYGINVDEPLLIRIQILSRHSKSNRYSAFLLVDKSKKETASVIGHYCQCKTGARTVGCCAHIMSVIWFLGYSRYTPTIDEPAKYLDDFFQNDVVITESDEDEDDVSQMQ